MGLTEEEADFLDSLTASTSTRPPPPPLKHKESNTRPRSSSLGLYNNPFKVSSNLIRPPSPSVSGAAGSISGLGAKLASSLWPQKGELAYPFHPSTFKSSSSPEPDPNSEANAEGRRVYLPPISPSRRSGPSESLPSLIPRLPRPPSPSEFSTPTPPKETSARTRPFLLRSPTVNWEGFGSGSSGESGGQNRGKGKEIFWTAIQEAGVPIYLGTPGFDGGSRPPYMLENMPILSYSAFALCPSALGTYCSPTALVTTLSDVEVFYHVYAAGQKLSREDLWVALPVLEKICGSRAILQGSVQRRHRRRGPTTCG